MRAKFVNCEEKTKACRWKTRLGHWRRALAGILLCFALSVAARSEPKRPHILGIRTVEIRVSNQATANQFYSRLNRVLGECSRCGEQSLPYSLLLPSLQRVVVWTGYSERPSTFVNSVGFEIDDVRAMEKFLHAKKVAFDLVLPVDGDAYLNVIDPEGHLIQFIEPSNQDRVFVEGLLHQVKKEASVRLIHTGFVVKDRAAMDKFYKDVLGFHVYWHGGMKNGETDWVDMQVPDGTDWIEYMLNAGPNPDKHTLGVLNHIALGVPDVRAAANQLEKNGVQLPEQPKIGRDGKWQLNLYDPDGTRVELMEFTPAEKPCCSEYTGPHPKP